MNICIISENSYPVSTGGVSEWCNSLLSNIPKHNFQIITIASNSKIKYDVPENVEVEIVEMDQPKFSNEILDVSLNTKIMDSMDPVFRGEPLDCSRIFQIVNEEEVPARDLISSDQNKKRMLSYYEQHYADKPFAPFFYSWTSLNYLLFRTLELVNNIPDTNLIHALNTGYAGILGSIGKISKNVPLLINEHGLYLKERLFELEHSEVPRWLHGFYEVFFNSLVKTSYKYSDEVTSVCQDHIEHQRKIYSEIEPKVVYNGIDVKKFNFNFKESSEQLSVGTVSRITPIKDQLTLIRSIPEVLAKNDAMFYIVGDVQDQEYYDECIQLSRELGIEENVEFTGFQDSSKWYPRFDVFILPSLSEGFPLTLLEAMSTGTPCVATNVGGVPEILEKSFLIDKWDPSALAGKISWLLEDADLRRKIAQRGRETVKNKFSEEKMVSDYVEIYEALI